MKKVKSKNRYIPRYENGSSFSEIARFLKSQIASFKPEELPKGFAAGSYGLQGAALGSQILGLAGQKTTETPYIANPSDVNAAFQKVPVGTSMDYLDKFFLGQQQSLARHAGAQGASAYDTANILAGQMGNASRARSETAIDLIKQNNEIDRGKAGFAIEEGARVNAAENIQRTNENQKLSLLSGKLAEGAGAFSNLNNQVFMNKQQVDFINNSKMAQLMNQLFTANFYDKLYSKKNG